MPKLYMETSVVSYLTARPSRDLVMAGHQQTTREWWEQRRKGFEIYASQLVWDEASVGDPAAVKRRLRVLKPLRWLQLRRDAVVLAKALVDDGPMPPNAEADALHVAADLELHAHQQRRHGRSHQSGLRSARISLSSDLHPG